MLPLLLLKILRLLKMIFFIFSALNETQKQYTNSNHHNNHLLNPSSDISKKAKTSKLSSPINIHIEVDIDPPPVSNDQQPQLSPEELQSLGLPTNHVHFDVNNNNKQLTSADSSEGEHHEELLAPSDIRVTYTEEDEEEKVRLTFFKHFNFLQ